MTLNIRLELPKEDSAGHDAPALEHEVIVSDELASVSKSHIEIILQKMAQILMAQGISCFGCPLSRYKLYGLCDASVLWWSVDRLMAAAIYPLEGGVSYGYPGWHR